MNTIEKGEFAQLKVEMRAIERGCIVSRPTVPSRYDLILDEHGKLARVQVKYGNGKTTRRRPCEGSVVASLHSNTCTNGSINYCAGEVDLIAVYVPRIDKVLMFGPDYFLDKSKLQIRIDPLPPAKRKYSIMAEDFIW